MVEDGQYKLDVAMAAFRKIMSTANPMAFFGESTAQAKEIAPEALDRGSKEEKNLVVLE